METEKFHVRSRSRFGKHILKNKEEKKAVAREVVERILWPMGVDTLFINDGSSVSYVWCYYLRRWVKEESRRLRIWTNNMDVPMQDLCEPKADKCPVEIFSSPGKFSSEYCAWLGQDTEDWVRENCSKGVCLLAATAFDAELGPCGNDPDARAIKRVILAHANFLVIVLDHEKLSTNANPALAANTNEWQKWIADKRERLWVVSGTCSVPAVPRAIPNPSNGTEWQERNIALLKQKLEKNHLLTFPV